MATIEELQKQIDTEVDEVQKIIEKALERYYNAQNEKMRSWIRQTGASRAQSIQQAMKRLKEVRNTIDPEKRVSLYKEIIDGICQTPSKLGADFNPKNSPGFSFNDEDIRSLKSREENLTQLQRQINQQKAALNQPKASQVQEKSPVPPSSPIGSLNTKAINHFLDSSIKQLESIKKLESARQLENAKNKQKSSVLSTYKWAKKNILSSFGKIHVSKNELLSQLQSELTNIKKAMGNEQNPIASMEALKKIEESIQRIEKIKKDRIEFITQENSSLDLALSNVKNELKLAQANVQLNQCLTNLITHANNHLGNTSDTFGNVIAERKAGKKEYEPNSLANKESMAGDFIAVAFPYPSTHVHRDQLVIDTITACIHAKPETQNKEVTETIHLISDLTDLCRQRDKLMDNLSAYKSTTDEKLILDINLELFNDNMDGVIKKLEAQPNEELRQMTELLREIQKDVVNSMPDSAPKMAKDKSMR
ncbi:MAG: hypothetical protein BGO43_09445 [Gammaproteobacteria bacterium 39-13]|nr:hypothetical protein [Gammaproteobacteria bacterium]OJV93866.1 MAG: hypothetical protein BGO43_09445 [Gammaproteobacteria bacterium 39-13]